MITLHHLDQSRSFRVVWLMEELGLPYDLVCHQRGQDMRAPAGLLALHALGKSPVVVDGTTLMFESGAILDYVVHRYGQGRFAVPPHHLDFASYLTWLHAAEGSCMPALMPVLLEALGGPAASAAQAEFCGIMLKVCDDELATRAYFGGGEFSIADIMMQGCCALAARFLARQAAGCTRLPAFLARVQGREGYRRALMVTNPHEPEESRRLMY